METIPGVYIESTYPHLSVTLDLVKKGGLFYDDGTYNIPSVLGKYSYETLRTLLNGGLVRIYIVQDTKTHKLYTNKEDIEILQKFVNDPDVPVKERFARSANIVQNAVITYSSKDKEMMKTFWNDFLNDNLK